jgi:hypothetical protein
MLGSNPGPFQLVQWQSDALTTRLDLIRRGWYILYSIGGRGWYTYIYSVGGRGLYVYTIKYRVGSGWRFAVWEEVGLLCPVGNSWKYAREGSEKYKRGVSGWSHAI